MELMRTEFDGLFILKLKKHSDNRGSFTKTFHASSFKQLGLESAYREDFYSISAKGVIRGMHFQLPPRDHTKIVYCTNGKVLDVALDLRRDSRTYGRSFSIELSEDYSTALYIPAGFAHGFQSLIDGSCLHYKTTTEHDPTKDTGIKWDSFGFVWTDFGFRPNISDRDSTFPPLSDFDSPFGQ